MSADVVPGRRDRAGFGRGRSAPSDRRIVSAVGAVSWVAFARLLLWNPHLFWSDTLGGLFDAQAVALRAGHLDIRDGSLGFEAFQMGSRSHSYFGLLPSLARIPVLAIAPSLRGQLTRLSMLAACAVLMVALGRLLLEALRRVPVEALGGWWRAWVAGLAMILGVLAGPMFLATRAWAYHEATLWGLAFGVAAIDLVLRAGHRTGAPSNDLLEDAAIGEVVDDASDPGADAIDGSRTGALRLWLGAALAAVLAMHCRFPTGLGAALAVGASAAWAVLDPSLIAIRRQVVRTAAGVFVVLTVGIGLYAAVNHARFDSYFGVPVERQLIAANPQFAAAIASNGGSLFGPRYLPSTLWAVARPNGVGLRSTFPGVGLPAARFAAIGGVQLASNERTASLVALAPLCTLIAAAGSIVALRRGLRRGGDRAPVELLCVLGTGAGTAGVLLIGYVATRYVADFFPLVATGLAVALSAIDLRRVPRAARRSLAGVAAVGLAWSVVATFGVSMQYQRELGIGLTDGAMLGWLRTQERLGPIDVVRSASVRDAPKPRLGAVLIVGGCAALYRGNGDSWRQLEASPAGGRLRVSVSSSNDVGTSVVASTTGATRVEFLVQRADGGVVRFGVRIVVDTREGATTWSRPVSARHLPRAGVLLSADPLTGFHSVRIGDDTVASILDPAPVSEGLHLAAGSQPGIAANIDRHATPTCDTLVG